jgi:hypothetical protein
VPYTTCISLETELPPPSKPPSLICLAKASRIDSSLGGGAPTHTAATEANLGAKAPLDATPTAIEDWLSHTVVTNHPPSVSFTVSLQNKLLLTSRSFRKKPCHVYYPVGRAWAPPPPATMAPGLCSFREPSQARRRTPGHPFIDRRSRLKWHRTPSPI